jgi:hypothetical protein
MTFQQFPKSHQNAIPDKKPHGPDYGHSVPGFKTARVTWVHEEEGTVDLFFDDGTVLTHVKCDMGESGPDRDGWDLPVKRSIVRVQFANGQRTHPLVVGYHRRQNRIKKRPPKKAKRRVFQNGGHVMMHHHGDVEIRFADGTQIVMSRTQEPPPDTTEKDDARDDDPVPELIQGKAHEDHTQQKKENPDGHPMKAWERGEVPDVDRPNKPAKPFQYNIRMADGTHFRFKDGTWTVKCPHNMAFEAEDVDFNCKTFQVRATDKIELYTGPFGVFATGVHITPGNVIVPATMFAWQNSPVSMIPFVPGPFNLPTPVPNIDPLNLATAPTIEP